MEKEMSWRELYSAAMLELDRARLEQAIESARAAIVLRMEGLARTDSGFAEEQLAMNDALQNLRSLQRMECETGDRLDRAASNPVAASITSQPGGAL